MLKNRIAVVAGAAGGIGKEISKLLSKNKSTVILFDKDINGINKLVEEITLECGDAFAYEVDVSDSNKVNDVMEKVIYKFKKIDILVNCAGIYETYRLLDTTDEIFNKVLKINLYGTFYLCRAAARSMIENRYGKIVNMTSLAGKTKSIYAGPSYSISKAGLVGLTWSLASQLAEFNINVNAVAPSMVETNMLSSLSKDEKERLILGIPLKRITTVNDIANLALFLVSDQSRNITGEVININGGVFMD